MQSDEMNIQENTMFDMRKCGAILSALRRKANLTQAQLAEKLGISYQAVSSWERGASMPDIGKLVDLARTLDTTVDYILSGEEAAPASVPRPMAEAETPQTLQVHVVSKLNPKKNASHSLTALLSLAPISGSGNAGSDGAGEPGRRRPGHALWIGAFRIQARSGAIG
ncbi:MAG: helix-turn-helix transcriptional regulator [Clostridia bacterium]|nr:helix-turn-helix transcriptional regulator [Clostridia bacterium]